MICFKLSHQWLSFKKWEKKSSSESKWIQKDFAPKKIGEKEATSEEEETEYIVPNCDNLAE